VTGGKHPTAVAPIVRAGKFETRFSVGAADSPQEAWS